MMPVTDVVIIIGVATTSIVTIINTIKGNNSRQILNDKADLNAIATDKAATKAAEASEKLDVIHELADGNLSKVSHSLSLANAKIDSAAAAQIEANNKIASLERIITQLIPTVPTKEDPMPVAIVTPTPLPVKVTKEEK